MKWRRWRLSFVMTKKNVPRIVDPLSRTVFSIVKCLWLKFMRLNSFRSRIFKGFLFVFVKSLCYRYSFIGCNVKCIQGSTLCSPKISTTYINELDFISRQLLLYYSCYVWFLSEILHIDKYGRKENAIKEYRLDIWLNSSSSSFSIIVFLFALINWYTIQSILFSLLTVLYRNFG